MDQKFPEATNLTQEDLLKIWFDTKPTVRDTYAMYGYAFMWETMRVGDYVLYTRPGRVMERPASFMPYQEVDGVHYRWQKDDKWIGQGMQSSFEWFRTHCSPPVM